MNKEFFVSEQITQKIGKFDSIIFDCDGVLVDIRNSYDEAINKTISAIMKELFDDDVGNVGILFSSDFAAATFLGDLLSLRKRLPPVF